MTIRWTLFLVVSFVLGACGDNDARVAPAAQVPAAKPAPTLAGPLSYPAARRVEQTDDYHGTPVADPYRWMEDLDSPELKSWIAAENEITERYLADAPGRDRIRQRLTALWNYQRYGVPVARGGRIFYSRNDGLQNQSPWYWQDASGGEEKLLLDPNTLSADGTIALSEFAVSDDGRRFAYSLSDGGSDWRTIKVREVETGKDTSDEVRWAKFTNIAWAKNGGGYYYSRYDAPAGENELKAVNKFQKLYFHALGKPQDDDVLVYERKDQPDWGIGAEVSDDGRYLVISISQGTAERNLLFFKDLADKDAGVVELIGTWEAAYHFVGNDGATFFVHTDKDAERYRLVAIDARKPGRASWREIVPQADATLGGVSLVNREFVASYLEDAHSLVKVFGLDGKPVRTLALPGLGTVAGFDGAIDSTETYYSYTGYTAPTAIYRYDAKTGETRVFRQPKVGFNPKAYETRQVFYSSKDGTRVPMFITARKAIALDGGNPTILFGYGGFNIAKTPEFSANHIVWMELGGIYAVANLRGGGEYGRAWHEAGTGAKKQNVFDDFAAAAEYLIENKYTRPQKLAINGRSNGGLLVAATMLQRPELFGAAVPTVGVHDMLRFREFTIGWAWESDYGSVGNPEEFKAIHAYSPLHNLKPGIAYPATLITADDRDDRVFPAHSFKFAATLQHAYRGDRPMLIRIDTRAGHGATGKPTSKLIAEQTDIFAFLTKTLGVTVD